MTAIANLLLRDARPDDRAHLLLWDTPNEPELQHIAFYNNAHRVNYRENLLGRINPSDRFLTLHHHRDRELETIKSMCSGVSKQVVLLEGLDCLITYLYIQSCSHITQFWNDLEKTRKLKKILWILLPHKLASKTWPEDRIKRISSG